MTQTNPLLALTNSSGFIFQIGVRHEIESTKERHAWGILAEEHHWRHPETDQSGFIDLIARHNVDVVFRMVIECKRSTGMQWIFLVPEIDSHPVDITSIFWTDRAEENQDVWGWATARIAPASPESSFCVVQGQGDKNTPMLERTSDVLLPSVEAIALEEMSLQPYNSMGVPAFYLPVIVTNAELFTCKFDAGNVSMDTGKLDDADIEPAKMVRFRKGLITGFRDEIRASSLEDANVQKQRSLWVVNSKYLAEILADYKSFENLDPALMSLIRTKREREGA